MKTHHHITGIFLAFISGIGLASFIPLSRAFILISLCVGVALFFILRGEYGKFSFFLSLFFGLGIFTLDHSLVFWQNLPPEILFRGNARVLTVEENKLFYRPVVLEPVACADACPAARFLLQAPLTFSGVPGDEYQVECALERPQNFDTRFDYQSYLATQDIGYLCKRPEVISSIDGKSFSFRRLLFHIREAVTGQIRSLLPEPEAGLALGLLLGGNDFLGKETAAMFAKTGLSHIVAISGYNMALLVQLTLLLGLLSGLWRKQAILVSGIAIFIFLILVGAPASGVRAALMTGAGFAAFFFGRLSNSWNGLLLAASLMLAFNPLLLRYDVGFDLSVLATLAIIIVSPLIEKWIPAKKIWGKVLTLLFFTIAIEMFTFPVLLTSFGQVSLLSPLTNLIILPLVPLAMLLALLILPFLFISHLFSLFLSLPLWLILHIQVRIVSFFAGLPFGVFTWEHIEFWQIALWYGMVSFGIIFLYRKTKPYVLDTAR